MRQRHHTARVSETRIRVALKQLSGIMQKSRYAEKYWPIFERLERELALRVDRAARLKAALEFQGD